MLAWSDPKATVKANTKSTRKKPACLVECEAYSSGVSGPFCRGIIHTIVSLAHQSRETKSVAAKRIRVSRFRPRLPSPGTGGQEGTEKNLLNPENPV